MTWLRQLLEVEGDAGPDRVPGVAEGRPVRGRGLRLHAEGRGEEPVGGLDAARLRLRRPHGRRPPLRRREGQRQDRPAPLPAASRATSSRSSPPSRSAGRRATGWRSCAPAAPATRSAPSSSASAATDAERRGREQLQDALRKRGLPPQRIAGSPLLADVTREMGFRKADDFYIAVGQGKISPKTVANKVIQRLKQGEAVAGDETEARLAGRARGPRRAPAAHPGGVRLRHQGQGRRRRDDPAGQVLPAGSGRRDRRLRLARARDHDPPRGLQERRPR